MSLVSADHRRVAGQLFKEFVTPFFVALAWAIFVGWGRPFNLAGFVASFAPAFFFVSWLLGQLFRVSNRVRTETSLGRIATRLDDVVGKLEESAKEAVAWATGGNSYAYAIPVRRDAANGPPTSLTLLTMGEYPLFQVSLRIVDVDAFAALPVFTEAALATAETKINFGDLDAARAFMNFADLPIGPIHGPADRKFNLFFMARNGTWTQLLRYRFDGAVWHVALRVTRATAEGESETLHEQVPENFPNRETLDWN